MKNLIGLKDQKLRVKWKTSFKMNFLKELIKFLLVRKKYWLFPIMILLAFFGLVIVLGSGSAVAPFIYTIF